MSEQELLRLSNSQYAKFDKSEKTVLDKYDVAFIKAALLVINEANVVKPLVSLFGFTLARDYKYEIPTLHDFKLILAYRARMNITGEKWGFQDQQTYEKPKFPSLSVSVPSKVFAIEYHKKNYDYEHYAGPLQFFRKRIPLTS
jgi:hypothetical protein